MVEPQEVGQADHPDAAALRVDHRRSASADIGQNRRGLAHVGILRDGGHMAAHHVGNA